MSSGFSGVGGDEVSHEVERLKQRTLQVVLFKKNEAWSSFDKTARLAHHSAYGGNGKRSKQAKILRKRSIGC